MATMLAAVIRKGVFWKEPVERQAQQTMRNIEDVIRVKRNQLAQVEMDLRILEQAAKLMLEETAEAETVLPSSVQLKQPVPAHAPAQVPAAKQWP